MSSTAEKDQLHEATKAVKFSPALSVDTGHHPPQPWCWGISGEAKACFGTFGVREMHGSEFWEVQGFQLVFLGCVEPQNKLYQNTPWTPKTQGTMKVLKAKNMGYAVIPAKNEGTVGSHLELFFFSNWRWAFLAKSQLDCDEGWKSWFFRERFE